VGKMSNVLLLEGDKILDCLHFRRVEEGAAASLRPRPGLCSPCSSRYGLPMK
jgi:hypothetical protein